jgi:hypothetical protein
MRHAGYGGVAVYVMWTNFTAGSGNGEGIRKRLGRWDLAEATYWILRKGEPYLDPALDKQVPKVEA